MQTIKFTPEGVSFKQIKQDAKRLSKKTDLTYQQALNQIVSEKTQFASWEKLNKHCDELGGSIIKYSYQSLTEAVFANRPLVIVAEYTKNLDCFIKEIKTPLKASVICKEGDLHKIQGIDNLYRSHQDLETFVKNSDFIVYKESEFQTLNFKHFKETLNLCLKHKKAIFLLNNPWAKEGKTFTDIFKFTHRILEPIKQDISESMKEVVIFENMPWTWSEALMKQAEGRRHRVKKPVKIIDILKK